MPLPIFILDQGGTMLVFVKKQSIVWISVLLLGGLLLGCSSSKAKKPRQQQSQLDDPQHHVLRGNDMVEKDRWTGARREFRLALEIDPAHSPALAGQALILSHDSTLAGKDETEIGAIQEESLETLDQALDTAKNDTETAQAHVAGIRVFTMLQGEDWLEKAEDHFEQAVDLYESQSELQNFRAEPYFYMARAYQQGNDFRKASAHYGTVLDLDLGFTREADRELARLQKGVRAQMGTRHGQRIAKSRFITRGDMAALLVEELRLRELYGRDAEEKQYDTSYKAPNKNSFASPVEKREVPIVTDIDKHPLRSDIEEILDIGVRGLEASPQHLFQADKKVTRGEYALMLEDILIQVTKDRGLSTRFIGESSPWPDVREDAFYYNAARTLVSRDIMGLHNKTRGEFGPDFPVEGADAVLGIRTLKSELRNYIRTPQS